MQKRLRSLKQLLTLLLLILCTALKSPSQCDPGAITRFDNCTTTQFHCTLDVDPILCCETVCNSEIDGFLVLTVTISCFRF